MKTFFRRQSVPAGLRRKWVVVPALTVLAVLIATGLWVLGPSGANSVWNQPIVAIRHLLDRVDHGQIATASSGGERIGASESPGRRSVAQKEGATNGWT